MKPDETTYFFALCSPDKRFPLVRNWFLKIIEEDRSQVSTVMESLKSALDLKFGHNRHYFNPQTQEPASELTHIFHPTVLTGYWIIGAIDLLDRYGVVYISENGSMFPPDPDKFIEHSIISSPVLVFPIRVPNEHIRVHKWPGGTHFYLTSTINRIFPKPKYMTMQEAVNDALLYVDRDKIKFNESYDTA